MKLPMNGTGPIPGQNSLFTIARDTKELMAVYPSIKLTNRSICGAIMPPTRDQNIQVPMPNVLN